jgi:enterochelin esterase-like enzyme
MNAKTRVCIVGIFAVVLAAGGVPGAQRRGGVPPQGPGGPGRGARATAGTVERITVHGKAIESNAQGESPDRAVTVYLPPSYAGDQARRFPTVYLLHGAGGSESTFTEVLARLPQSADRLAGAQGFSEFIVVTPNATPQKGSLYASSPATGDWDKFVAEDLVGYVDGHYRTLAHRMSRGLAGHDAGGYAAIRIGMKRPDVFANLFVMGASGDPGALEIDKYASNLNAYYGIAIDIGLADTALESSRQLHAAMTRARIPHAYEEYDGDHTNKLRDRIEWNILPFFARNLAAPANLTSPSAAADRLSTAGR